MVAITARLPSRLSRKISSKRSMADRLRIHSIIARDALFPSPHPGTFFRKCSFLAELRCYYLAAAGSREGGRSVPRRSSPCSPGRRDVLSRRGPWAFRRGLWCHHEERSDEGSAFCLFCL